MSALELLAPAGGPEWIRAAVCNGADAVYLGVGGFNARKNAKNFTPEEFKEAVVYCRVRGVKVYVTLNTLLSDRELIEASELVREIDKAGADAVLVQDLGVLRMVRQTAPELPVHASTQMSIHNLNGAKAAKELGISRVVLARELSKQQIAYICRNADIETEVFVHGALCMCYSGQCYMSSVIGQRSGNRGVCAQPCRLPYGFGSKADSYPLSLKDLSLWEHLDELAQIGVTAVKIEGRMKSPEYAALSSWIFSRAIKEGINPTEAELSMLRKVFSRQGFTDGYYEGEIGPKMFGIREGQDGAELSEILGGVRETYKEGVETQRVGVSFYGLIRAGEQSMLAVEDAQGNTCRTQGEIPAPAISHETSATEIKTQLYKTGGTPYKCESVKVYMEKELNLPLSAVNAMRREALGMLTDMRSVAPVRESGEYKQGAKYLNRREAPDLTFSVSKGEQLSPELLAMSPKIIYFPLTELVNHMQRVLPVINSGETELCVALPRILGDNDASEIKKLLSGAYKAGIRTALIGNLGQLETVSSLGFEARGDYGLNVFNSQTLKELKHMELISSTLSFELSFPQIRDISKCMDTEIIVYGRLPLMITENCVIKNKGVCACENVIELTDRTGAIFPVIREHKHRSTVLNSKKMFLADKAEDYSRLGAAMARLMFTTENARECIQVAERYMGDGKYTPNTYTRGLYYRGIE